MLEITKNQNEIPRIFENAEFGEMRVVTIHQKPWFVAKDVCEILEVGNVSQALKRLDNEDRNTIIINEGIGNPEKSIVNESGLYSLIFTSRKPEAKKFKKWVTAEVLPAIRKTGSYTVENPTSPAEILLEQTKILVDLEQRQKGTENKLNALQLAVDSKDNLELETDRQKLGALVKEYANLKGLQYKKGWEDFVRYYNNAYNTNLTNLKRHYEKKQDRKKMTTPEYLEATGDLGDGIRVAKKMLNQAINETENETV